ncbi:MAG: TonB-dependent receptor [Vicinamibacterales bacterium]
MFQGVLRVAVVAVLSVVPALGQLPVAELNGTAVDQSGSVLPGAAITITEETTGLVRATVSNDTGRFVLPGVTPGRYTVRAELAGFQTQTRTGITVQVGQALTINFTLPIGALTDQITVTGESPLVEVTQTQIGTNISQEDIENLPMQGRVQMSLMQLVPGLVPNLTSGTFEGTNYSANGRETQGNLYLVDGVHNRDDRSMAFAQANVTVDSMAEYQVMTHQYGAEYGGASGVIVNAVTKSGTNQFHGRGFYYLQDNGLNGTNYFTKQRGEKDPESGSDILGGNIGGPILRNKAFFFFNYERTWLEEAVALEFPREAAPLAVSFSDVYKANVSSYFARVDYQLTSNNLVNFRVIMSPNDGIGENAESEQSIKENFRWERSQEMINSASWTATIGNRMLNELKVSSTLEALKIADRRLFNDAFNDNPYDIDARAIPGFRGVNPIDFGAMQQHPDYRAGPRAANTGHFYNTIALTEQFTYTPGNHTFKFGFGASSNGGDTANAPNQIGTFDFLQNQPFNPADPSTYPSRYRIRLGEMFIPVDDWRTSAYVSDKWQATGKLTLNLGVRHEYQHITPWTKDAFAPRLGVAYAPSDRLVFRAGFGRFYEIPATAVLLNLFQGGVIPQAFVFDTAEDTSALRGVRPAHPCLNPVGDGQGRAAISAACRAQLVAFQDQLATGRLYNRDPLLAGDRKLGYLWSYSAGVESQILPNVAVRLDYVGNVGRDLTGRIDINEGPLGPDGRVTRLGVNVFDPTGVLIPAAARGTAFRRVLQYQTLDAFNSDYNALEVSVEKRMANRWSGRLSYTLSRARDVNSGSGMALIERRVNDDRNPRADYSLANLDNRHAFATGGNWDAWRGLGIGATFVYYTGNPANELVGVDVNSDTENTDRPVRGRDDATRPIVSKVDANGMAVRNGMKGSEKMLLNLRLQYLLNQGAGRNVGFYAEIYNVTDRVNFDNPINNRRSPNFARTTVADEPRTMQLGIRYAF